MSGQDESDAARGSDGELRGLLARLDAGDPAAEERVWDLLYHQLRQVAHRLRTPEATLQTTALVHELFLRLAGSTAGGWQGRDHFVNAAARAMRQILVDRARRRQAAKRDAGLRADTDVADLEVADPAARDRPPEEVLEVHRALGELARSHPRLARLTELRFFAGLTLEEAAAALDISRATAVRDWRAAKTWLYSELQGPAGPRGEETEIRDAR